jgi:hypothetical protein
MTKRPSAQWLLSRSKPESTYLKILHFYWQGEKSSAVTLLSHELSEGNIAATEPYYRLWIETLAEDSADDGLRELIHHLERNVSLGLMSTVSGTALIALGRYELGEREAAVMLWRSVQSYGNDPYARELSLILSSDDEVKEQGAHTLMRISGDYFHLRRSTLHFHSESLAKAYRQSIGVIDKVFAGNPLHAEIGFHRSLSKGRMTAAWKWAKFLHDGFPQQNEYQFFFAYAAYLTRKTGVAMSELESLNRKAEGTDPDVLHLLGLSVFKESGGRAEDLQRARSLLNRSKDRYQTLGYPALQLEESLTRLSPSKFKEGSKYWIVKLTPRQAWDLGERSEASIQTLHKAMGEYVARGDYCFFVTENRLPSKAETGLWRMHAVYRASSDAEWHPTHRFKTALELVVRMGVSIPIEFEGAYVQSRNQEGAYGLLELDSSALRHFEECFQEYTLEDPSFSGIFDTIRYSRAG